MRSDGEMARKSGGVVCVSPRVCTTLMMPTGRTCVVSGGARGLDCSFAVGLLTRCRIHSGDDFQGLEAEVSGS